jgi:hypothetical protein
MYLDQAEATGNSGEFKTDESKETLLLFPVARMPFRVPGTK